MAFLNPIDAAPLKAPLPGTSLLGVAPTVEIVDEQPFNDQGDPINTKDNRSSWQTLVKVDGVPFLVPTGDLKSRWEGGMEWLPEGWRVTGTAGYTCSSHPDRTGDVDVAPTQDFVPFEVWAEDECSTLDSERDRWGRAVRALLADQSFQVAGELERGVVSAGLGLGNPTLEADCELLLLSSTVLAEVLVAMDDALTRRLRNRQGLFHMSPAHLSAAKMLNWLEWSGSTPYSPNGHAVVADGGYESAGTDDPTSVIYGTDMMRIWLGPIRYSPRRPDGVASPQTDLDTNDLTVRAFRTVGIQWDHAAHIAATTDIGVSLPEFVDAS